MRGGGASGMLLEPRSEPVHPGLGPRGAALLKEAPGPAAGDTGRGEAGSGQGAGHPD